MEMKKRVSIAKKRRAKFLAEFERRECTIQKMADKYGVTNARMWKMLKMAKDERNAQS